MITIIMPYFRKRKYVKQSVNSILRQTYKNFELILIYDDHVKDDVKFIKKIADMDQRIRLIINKKNLGAGYSRNVGIEKSNGFPINVQSPLVKLIWYGWLVSIVYV